MYKLNQIPLNTQCTVLEVEESPLGDRLLDMGLVPGTPVERVLSAPGGDPIAVLVHGDYLLGIRRDEAEAVTVYFET